MPVVVVIVMIITLHKYKKIITKTRPIAKKIKFK